MAEILELNCSHKDWVEAGRSAAALMQYNSINNCKVAIAIHPWCLTTDNAMCYFFVFCTLLFVY